MVEFVDVFSSQGQLLADPSAFGYGRKSLVFERPERRSVNDFSRQKLPQSNPWILDSTPHVPALMLAQFNALLSLAILTKFMLSLCSKSGNKFARFEKNGFNGYTTRQDKWHGSRLWVSCRRWRKPPRKVLTVWLLEGPRIPRFFSYRGKKHENAAGSTFTLTI